MTPDADARPEAVILGAGLMGRWHAHAVRRCAHRVAAVVDADLARARALAVRHPGALAAVSLDEVLRPGRVVHVCTPLEHHAGHATKALDAGCHVLVEKPLSGSAASTTALLGRARDAGRLLVPVHQYLFQPGVERARRAVSELGPVLHADVVACTAGADGRSPADRDEVVLQVLPHPLSLLEHLLGPVVGDAAWHVAHPQPGELRVTGVARRASVSILVSARGRPTRHQMVLICAGGTIRLDLFHGYAVVVRGAATRAFKVVHPYVDAIATLGAATANMARRIVAREPAYPGLRELVRRVYSAAEGGRPPIDDAQTLAVAIALDAIRAGASAPRLREAPDSSLAAAGPVR